MWDDEGCVNSIVDLAMPEELLVIADAGLLAAAVATVSLSKCSDNTAKPARPPNKQLYNLSLASIRPGNLADICHHVEHREAVHNASQSNA